MGVFDNFPYTNVHDLNTDWLVKTVKEVKDKTDEIDRSVQDAKNYADNAKTSEDNAAISASNAEDASQNAINTYSQVVQYTENLTRQVNENTANIATNSARIDTFTNLALGSTTGDAELMDGRVGYDGFIYPNIGDAIRKQTSELHADLANFTKKTSNLYNQYEIVANHYIGTDGSSVSSANFSHTALLPVNEGDIMYFWSRRTDNTFYYFDARFLCAYDSTKTAVPASGGTFVGGNGVWSVPNGISYICLSISNSYLSQWTDFYIGTRPMVDGVTFNEPYGVMPDPSALTPTIELDNGGSILEALKLCYQYGIHDLHVKNGVFDIIAEYENRYGSSYFTNYTNYATSDPFDRGLWLENINVKFDPFARVLCNYSGNNTNVTDYFSAFACGNNVVIDGLFLSASNLRYGLHPDFNSGSETTYFKMKNCVLSHYRDNDQTNKIIGAGLGIHVEWEFENIIFRTKYESYVLRIHNNISASAFSKVTIKNCYIENNGYFVFNSYSNATWRSPILVTGCSYNKDIEIGLETPTSNVNLQVYAFNNERR